VVIQTHHISLQGAGQFQVAGRKGHGVYGKGGVSKRFLFLVKGVLLSRFRIGAGSLISVFLAL
jgi:hypothetical protein